MMTGYLFPGQGSQVPGMGKSVYEKNRKARDLFEHANEILGFRISDIMFDGSAGALKQTRVTQPAIFLHSVILIRSRAEPFTPDVVAGHSLGEFSALVACGALDFKTGLTLVFARAMAMQRACDIRKGTMAAIIGLDDEVVEDICAETDGIVVPANYNCPGQLVISGEMEAVGEAIALAKEKGARRALELQVGGAFHSPLMEPAREELAIALEKTEFKSPLCPIYQNVDARPTEEPGQMKQNLIAQLTSPVRWTQTMASMHNHGITHFIEVGGKGNVLAGLFKRFDRKIPVESIVT